MKKERGKAVETYNTTDLFQDYSTPSDFLCKKHPSSSPVGVCAQCLKDRLVKLVCSDCGEQRLSSCSCSEISPTRNSCTVEVGSVGRVSFLIENDNQKPEIPNSKPKLKGSEKANDEDDGVLLKRSSSSCVEMKRRNGFWGIRKLFRKKREKGNFDHRSTVNGFEEKSDLWVVDYMGVSRSRSLCSVRNGGFWGSEDGTFSGARSSISAARSSISAARNSGLFDPERKSGFSETEPRRSGFDYGAMSDPEPRRMFSLKEGNFTTVDDSGFIDLKFDFPSESRSEIPSLYSSSAFGSMRSGAEFVGEDRGVLNNGGSCRITVNDRGIKRSRKSFKSWRWIFKPNSYASKKDDEDFTVRSVVG